MKVFQHFKFGQCIQQVYNNKIHGKITNYLLTPSGNMKWETCNYGSTFLF